MTDKLRCELYHAFDGHCCADGEACPLKPRPPTAEYVAAMHRSAQKGMMLGAVAVTTISAIFLFGLILTEADLARQAKTNQENIAWNGGSR